MPRKLILASSVLLITLSISCSPAVNQQEVKELNSHLDALSASLQWTQNKLLAAEDSANNANARITQLQEQLNQVSTDISRTEELAAYATYTTQSPALIYYDQLNDGYPYGYQYTDSYPYPYLPPTPPPAPPLPPPTLTVNITASATADGIGTATTTEEITVDRPTTIYVNATATTEYVEAAITVDPLLSETLLAIAPSGSQTATLTAGSEQQPQTEIAAPVAEATIPAIASPATTEITVAVAEIPIATIVTPTAVEQPVASMTSMQSSNYSPTIPVSTESTVTIPDAAGNSQASVSSAATQPSIVEAPAAIVEPVSTPTTNVSSQAAEISVFIPGTISVSDQPLVVPVAVPEKVFSPAIAHTAPNPVTAIRAARPVAPASAKIHSVPIAPKPDPVTTQQRRISRVTVPHNSVNDTSTAATSAVSPTTPLAIISTPAITVPAVTAPAPPPRKPGSNITNRIKRGEAVN